jgi:hypothetical protein
VIVSNSPLGFSIRSVGRGIKSGVQATGHGIKKGAKVVGKAAYFPVEWTLIKPTQWLAHQAARPIKGLVLRLEHRRAVKLAWDKRKSKTPNAQELAEAKSWTKHTLNHQLPHGPILALFAGSDAAMLGYYENVQLGIAPAVVAAAIPVFMAVMQNLLSRFSKSGEAPADPGADAQAAAADQGPPPGVTDLQPAQDAAADAVQNVADKVRGGGKSVKLPGVGRVKQSYLMIGGAVALGLVLVVMLKGGDKKKAA